MSKSGKLAISNLLPKKGTGTGYYIVQFQSYINRLEFVDIDTSSPSAHIMTKFYDSGFTEVISDLNGILNFRISTPSGIHEFEIFIDCPHYIRTSKVIKLSFTHHNILCKPHNVMNIKIVLLYGKSTNSKGEDTFLLKLKSLKFIPEGSKKDKKSESESEDDSDSSIASDAEKDPEDDPGYESAEY